MSPEVLTLALAAGLSWLIVSAFSKKKAKTITGWLTVVFPTKKKGKRKRK